jgi:phosphoserine phosphatase RsbU/P
VYVVRFQRATCGAKSDYPHPFSLSCVLCGEQTSWNDQAVRKDRSIVTRGNDEAQSASDTNSTGYVVRASEQAAHQLACTEVWGGNNITDQLVKLPGLVGLIHSKPVEPAKSGGDVYYVSVCDKRVLSRVVLADVAGHGEAVLEVSARLRTLMKKYINTFDQSALMREVNEAFYRENGDLEKYATAVVLSHDCRTGELIFASAAHPPTLWYHAREREWDWLHERMADSVKTFEGLPLGLAHGTEYQQTRVRLAEGDLLTLYTDGITECANKFDRELGYEGLRELLRSLPVESPIAAGSALVTAVEEFRGSTPCRDDQSVIVLQRTDGCLS